MHRGGVLLTASPALGATYHVGSAKTIDTLAGGCTLVSASYYECDSLRLAVSAANAAGGGDIVLEAATTSCRLRALQTTTSQAISMSVSGI